MLTVFYIAGPAAKAISREHLTVAHRRPVRPLRGEADELAIARGTMCLASRDLVGFVIYVVEHGTARGGLSSVREARRLAPVARVATGRRCRAASAKATATVLLRHLLAS